MIILAGATFYLGYHTGDSQPSSSDCAAIKAEADKRLEEGDRFIRIHDGNTRGVQQSRVGAHLIINNPACYAPADVASAQALLDAFAKLP